MARHKQVSITLTQAIMRRLAPHVDGRTAMIPMAIVVSVLRFHKYMFEKFQAEFSGEDWVEWDVIRGWLYLMEMK